MTALPMLRQIVLITDDLEPALKHARAALGLHEGLRDAEGMAAIGFTHEVLAIDQTFLEIVAPVSMDSPQARQLDKYGPGGFMAVLQVADLPAVRAHAQELGFGPLLDEDYEGQPITQWNPKDLGTIAEIDQMTPADHWHFAPKVFEIGSTEVVQDIRAVDIAVDEPIVMAARWAQLLGQPVDGPVVPLGGGQSLRFVAADGARGVCAVDVIASDARRVGDAVTLCGVDFRFVGA